MLLRFTKMHGLGNDFAMVDLISQNLNDILGLEQPFDINAHTSHPGTTS